MLYISLYNATLGQLIIDPTAIIPKGRRTVIIRDADADSLYAIVDTRYINTL